MPVFFSLAILHLFRKIEVLIAPHIKISHSTHFITGDGIIFHTISRRIDTPGLEFAEQSGIIKTAFRQLPVILWALPENG